MLLLNGVSEEALVTLINASNPLDIPLEPGGLFYGKPKPIADGYVSVKTVTSYNNGDYDGYSTFEYKRVNLTKVFGSTRPVIKTSKLSTMAELLPRFNKILGLNLQANDIVNTGLTWGDIGSQQNFQVTASDSSLGYEGRFVVQCILTRFALAEVIKKTTVPTFGFPDAKIPGKKSVGMMTWGIDFTDEFDVKSIIVAGIWNNLGLIQRTMLKHGLANWPQVNKFWVLSIRLTKDVPGANRAYSHVIVQPDINTAEYNGTAYIHFNVT